MVFWEFDVAVDGKRPHLCHAVDSLVGEVAGGATGDTVKGVGHWCFPFWGGRCCYSVGEVVPVGESCAPLLVGRAGGV